MSNFELIDNYLTNRLSELDRKLFEQEMASDPTLKADVDLQNEIIQGLKAARAAELKTMLNQVTISAPIIYLSPMRIAAGFIGATVLATGLYFYVDLKENFNPTKVSSSFTDSVKQSEQITIDKNKDSIPVVDESNVPPKSIDKAEKITEKKVDISKVDDNSKRETKPVIDLIDPTEELNDSESEVGNSGLSKTTVSVAKINVDVISTERKFKSHYQFANGKLVLYGNFDNGLYEIIEVNAQQNRSLFLYYKSVYFLLDETQHEVTLLKEITDPVLKEKLKEFRNH